MNLKALKDHLDSLDTFGLDAAQIEVEFKTDLGGVMEFKDIQMNVQVTPKLTSKLTIAIKHKANVYDSMYGGR